MIFLETNRLLLRNVTPEDADIMYDYRNHESCARFQRGQIKEREGIAALTQRRKNDRISVEASFMLAAALRENNEMIGEIVTIPDDGMLCLGYTFSYRYHRKGYAFEALTALLAMLHERYPDWYCISFTEPENAPSRALLKKLGYRDMGYSVSMESQVFGKWLSPEVEARLAEVVEKK